MLHYNPAKAETSATPLHKPQNSHTCTCQF